MSIASTSETFSGLVETASSTVQTTETTDLLLTVL